MIDWLNPSDDVLEARNIGRHDRDNEIESLGAEVERLMVLGVRYSDERIAAESDAARQRERADRAENDKTICETANRNLVKSRIAWRERVDALEKAAALLALPYEGLLADSDSRRWIAPALWAAIETGVMAFRALLSPASSAEPSAEPSTEAKEESRE